MRAPRARLILQELKRSFTIHQEDYVSLLIGHKFKDPFATLVATILSQSSTDINSLKAFNNLDERVGVKPELLARASIESIEAAIKIGGLHRTKSRALKQLAIEVLQRFKGNLTPVLELPFTEARKSLTSLPKVGPKTADVLLVTLAGKPTIPVDTHVNRVSKRLGLAPETGKYEHVRAALQAHFPKRDYHKVHLHLIALGRHVCKAGRPLCSHCPVKKLCPFPNKTT